MRKIIYIAFLFIIASCSQYSDYEHEYLDANYKEPFGLYVMKQELKDLYPEQKFISIHRNFIDDVLQKKEVAKEGNYVAIADKFKMNGHTSDELLRWVSEGNVAFIAANELEYDYNNVLDGENGGLSSALGIQFGTNTGSNPFNSSNASQSNDFVLRLTAENFNNKNYSFERYLQYSNVYEYNANTTTVLGTYEDELGGIHPNFFRIKYGDGYFYIHTQPLVFSNHYLLKTPKNAAYVAGCFSYLREGSIFWDSDGTYKDQRSRSKKIDKPEESKPASHSFLDEFLKNDSLRMALYTFLAGFVFFVLLRAKRRQRIIPIIKPLENTTVAFTKTISNLYLASDSNEDIATKKINYFYEKIRSDLRINTQHINEEFIIQLQQRTGYDRGELNKLFNLLRDMNAKILVSNVEDTDLIQLDQEIQKFYTHTKI